MAVQRLTLAQLETAILEAMGYASSSVAPWNNAATLYLRINDYMQRLPQKIADRVNDLRSQGMRIPYSGVPRFDMWRSTGNMTTASGNSTVFFPTDYDHYVGFWDATNNRTIDPISDVERFHIDLKKAPAGPPEAIEILGFVTNGSTWVRQGKMYPSTVSGTTPSISLTYWRIPANMPGNNAAAEYPDIDPKWESLPIYGTITDIARPSAPEYDRYTALENALLMQLAMTAKGT